MSVARRSVSGKGKSNSLPSVASKNMDPFDVAFLNVNGQILLQASGEGKIELDISTVPKGLYLIRTLQNGALTYTKWMKI
jgi:hypothetical protein